MNWHNLDPALPRLADAFDSQALIEQVAQQSCSTRGRRQSIDYVPGSHCTTTYLLTDDNASWQTIGVVHVTTNDVHYRLFTDDPQLASLGTAMNTQALTRHFAIDGSTDGGIHRGELGPLATVTPVRYKPGSRCTLRYQTERADGQESFFGKLLAHESAEIAQAVDDLYRASQETPLLPAVARPLAYWPELQMLVQAAVMGEELHDLLFDTERALATRIGWLYAAGQATAALHSTHIDIAAPPQTLTGDLIALDEYQPALCQLDPQLADRFVDAIDIVAERAGRQSELHPTVSHGALRTDQFMIEKEQLVLIDLDSLCLSSPARDLGNFLGYLTWKALRQPQHAAFLQRGQAAFLDGYRSIRPLPDADWITLYQVASMLKIIGRRYTGLTYREWSLTGQLLEIGLGMVQA